MKKLLLIWILNSHHEIVAEGDVRLLQEKKKSLKTNPNYQQGKLIVRTREGYRSRPLWTGKKKIILN